MPGEAFLWYVKTNGGSRMPHSNLQSTFETVSSENTRVQPSPEIGAPGVQRMSFSEMLRSDDVCRGLLEKARWPQGPDCPNCGVKGSASRLTTRSGFWTCRACRNCQFSVTSGTRLHRTRLPVSAWVRLFHATQIAGQSFNPPQVSRRFGVAYLTAESMLQRVEALKDDMPEMAARLEAMLRDLASESIRP